MDTKYKNWDVLTSKRNEAMKAAYAIIIGHCSDAVKEKMKTYPKWKTIQADLDVIELLRLIRTYMYSGTVSRKPTLVSKDTACLSSFDKRPLSHPE